MKMVFKSIFKNNFRKNEKNFQNESGELRGKERGILL